MAMHSIHGLQSPMMQTEYLKRINRAAGLGFVNPQLQVNDYLRSVSSVESQRLHKLDMAGEERERIKTEHDQDVEYKNKVFAQNEKMNQESLDYRNALLNMRDSQLQSAKRGGNLAFALGLGRVGLGAWDAYKTREEAVATSVDAKNKLIMQLSYLKKTNPEMYQWYLNQPYIASKLKRYGVI